MYIATEIKRTCGHNPQQEEFSVVSEDPEKLKDFFRNRFSKVCSYIPWKENAAHYNKWESMFSYKIWRQEIEVLIIIEKIGFIK